jgi:hypothetical protein
LEVLVTRKESAVRLSKREQLRAERKRRSLLFNVILIGGSLLVVLGIVAYAIANQRPGALPGEQLIPDEGAGHVSEDTALTFQHYPPSSGAHYPSPVSWGVYQEPVRDGYFVHNLEHGGVVFLYSCPEDCSAVQQQFDALFEKIPPETTFNQKKVVISPYAGELPTSIVALAWDHQLNLDTFDENAMLLWYKRFVNRGPELVP